MKLSIIYYPKMKRPWLLKREYGEYEQHAHLFTEKHAKDCRKLIDSNKYPNNKYYREAIKRILTEEEFKGLRKKQRYYNSNRGVIRRGRGQGVRR